MIQFSKDGKYYAVGYSGASNYVVAFYDYTTHENLLKFEDRRKEFLSISPESKYIATVYEGITIYDIASGNSIWNFKPKFESIHSLCFSPDGKLFAAAGEFETDWDFNDPSMTSAALWNLETGNNLWETRCGLFSKVLFSPDGKKLYTIGTADVNRTITSSVSSADIGTGAFQDIFVEKFRLRFWDFDISPDGTKLICSGNYYRHKQDNVPLIIVDLNSERKKVVDKYYTHFTVGELKRLVGHTSTVSHVMFSPDGVLAASVSSDGTVRIWDVESAKEIHEIKIHAYDLAFSPDGSVLGFMHGGKLHLYDTSSWEMMIEKKIY